MSKAYGFEHPKDQHNVYTNSGTESREHPYFSVWEIHKVKKDNISTNFVGSIESIIERLQIVDIFLLKITRNLQLDRYKNAR